MNHFFFQRNDHLKTPINLKRFAHLSSNTIKGQKELSEPW